MATYQIRLKSKKEIADGTMAFYFEKPAGFTYKAGQYAEFKLIDPKETDEEGNGRAFSLANAPYQEDIMFATRMRDTAFKRNLKNMETGAELTMEGPSGSFTLPNNTKSPVVFLSGGIGITPMHSMLLQAAHDKTEHKLFLFYANNSPKTTAFLDDLLTARKENPNFTFVPSMTKLEGTGEKWEGETGFFREELLKKYLPDLSAPIYFISGPASMVSSIRKTLTDAGIDDDNIRTEEFAGY
ncbi:ferredoxin--NADP reductase [Adhaeribacter terreus]|uniref:Ferredoxin--NADP reductase n=1 Tax=Adhaeribacter terreus TaxID=529703 RepID=A0ABW0EAK0_9BACT